VFCERSRFSSPDDYVASVGGDRRRRRAGSRADGKRRRVACFGLGPGEDEGHLQATSPRATGRHGPAGSFRSDVDTAAPPYGGSHQAWSPREARALPELLACSALDHHSATVPRVTTSAATDSRRSRRRALTCSPGRQETCSAGRDVPRRGDCGILAVVDHVGSPDVWTPPDVGAD